MKRALSGLAVGGLVVAFVSGVAAAGWADDAPDVPKNGETTPKAEASQKDENAKKVGALVRERFQGKAAEIVKAADADANGELSQEEFEALLQSARQARAEIAKAVRSELGLPKGERRPKKPADAAGDEKAKAAREEFVKKYDKDGDGKLSKDERRQAMEDKKKASEEQHKSKAAEAFAKADANGDGKITTDEATQFLTAGPKKK